MIPKRVGAIINLDNIKKNIEPVVNRLHNKAQVMGIIKSDAYGHGAVEVAKVLSECGVKSFGVAAVNEAVELRKNNINEEILILGQIFDVSFPLITKYNITSTIFDKSCAIKLSDFALSQNTQVKAFIKIDTGMGRIGFEANTEGYEDIKYIFENCKGLKILGAYTHFANADSKDKSSAKNQKNLFLTFTDNLIKNGYPLPIRHMYNSAAIMEMDDDYVGEVVRCGIMTYGLYPSDEIDRNYKLYPCMELKSSVAFIKKVPKGYTVGYGSTFVTEKDTTIATIPVGYGDGYPRYLSNKGRVLINGEYCKILGRICMDQFMVDVTNLQDVKIGDTVTLIGKDGDKFIPIEELCDDEYRFNYEFCCLINKRVPRVYLKNHQIYKTDDTYLDHE